jgi:hypothetical protein
MLGKCAVFCATATHARTPDVAFSAERQDLSQAVATCNTNRSTLHFPTFLNQDYLTVIELLPLAMIAMIRLA